jgi:NADPH-dependent 2,4-dienoyl-CoA reductase/sulfur reductase-like enzyme
MFRQLAASTVSPLTSRARAYATASASKAHHKVVIVGGGTAGVTVAAQLRRSREAQDYLQTNDIAIIDKADVHSYQPGWTLVGTGLRSMSDMRRPMADVIPSGVQHYPMQVAEFSPDSNSIKTAEGFEITYDYLVVAPGLKTDYSTVKGLEVALADPTSSVSSIYSEPSAEQTWRNIEAFEGGDAIFTQPAGVFKCAGAPQKVLWMALSQWKMDGKRDKVRPTFATGAACM